MAGETAPEAEVAPTKEEQEEAQAFSAGFEDGAAAPAAATTEGQAATTEAAPGTETPAEEVVEYVQVSKKDFERILAAADKTEAHAGQFDKVFGTVGNMQQLINRLQAATPAGEAVEATEEDVAELAADFPELAGQIRGVLNKVLKRTNAKGTAEAATPAIDAETVDFIKKRRLLQEMEHEHQLLELDELHPGWRDVVGKPGDAETPFRKWLATQPEKYQNMVNASESATITKGAIDKFEAAQAAAAKPAAQPSPKPTTPDPIAIRKDRIEAAVTPKGTGVAPPKKPLTEEDHFQAGFASG